MTATESFSDHVAVLIPALNASSTLPSIIQKIQTLGLHILVCDDGSTDATGITALNAGAQLLANPLNCGKGESLRRLFHKAEQIGFQAVITLDADGQHDPGWIPHFLREYRRQPDVLLIGNRFSRPSRVPLLRLFGNWAASCWISKLYDLSIQDSQCGMRLIPMELLSQSKTKEEGFVMETEFLCLALESGWPVRQIEIPALYSQQQSHFECLADSAKIASFLLARSLKRIGSVPLPTREFPLDPSRIVP